MSDVVDSGLPSIQTPAAPTQSASDVDSLARSVRRMKIWVGILTAAVVLLVFTSCALSTAWFFWFGGIPMDPGMSVPDAELDVTRDAFESAYGGNIDRLEVRKVVMDYGQEFSTPLFGAGGEEENIYVECQLVEPQVLIADLVSYAYGLDAASAGMIPTAGSLRSRLTEDELTGLLTAYGDETDNPIGSIRRYDDRDQWMYDEGGAEEEVRVGTETYPTAELWAVTEGFKVEGDTVDMNTPIAYDRTAHIFHLDPESGEFTYLGTEPGYSTW